MKHWTVEQIAWDRFDPSKVEPGDEAAAMVERNGDDDARHLKSVSKGDPDFHLAAYIRAGEASGETQDNELALPFPCGHDGSGVTHEHDRCIAGSMGRALGFHRFGHIERGMGMIFKAIGLERRGGTAGIAAMAAWRVLCWRQDRCRRALQRLTPHGEASFARAV